MKECPNEHEVQDNNDNNEDKDGTTNTKKHTAKTVHESIRSVCQFDTPNRTHANCTSSHPYIHSNYCENENYELEQTHELVSTEMRQNRQNVDPNLENYSWNMHWDQCHQVDSIYCNEEYAKDDEQEEVSKDACTNSNSSNEECFLGDVNVVSSASRDEEKGEEREEDDSGLDRADREGCFNKLNEFDGYNDEPSVGGREANRIIHNGREHGGLDNDQCRQIAKGDKIYIPLDEALLPGNPGTTAQHKNKSLGVLDCQLEESITIPSIVVCVSPSNKKYAPIPSSVTIPFRKQLSSEDEDGALSLNDELSFEEIFGTASTPNISTNTHHTSESIAASMRNKEAAATPRTYYVAATPTSHKTTKTTTSHKHSHCQPIIFTFSSSSDPLPMSHCSSEKSNLQQPVFQADLPDEICLPITQSEGRVTFREDGRKNTSTRHSLHPIIWIIKLSLVMASIIALAILLPRDDASSGVNVIVNDSIDPSGMGVDSEKQVTEGGTTIVYDVFSDDEIGARDGAMVLPLGALSNEPVEVNMDTASHGNNFSSYGDSVPFPDLTSPVPSIASSAHLSNTDTTQSSLQMTMVDESLLPTTSFATSIVHSNVPSSAGTSIATIIASPTFPTPNTLTPTVAPMALSNANVAPASIEINATPPPNSNGTTLTPTIRMPNKTKTITPLNSSQVATVTSNEIGAPATFVTPNNTNASEIHNGFSFFLMGDVPYNIEEEALLAQQLKEIAILVNSSKGNISESPKVQPAAFIAHVGDFGSVRHNFCEEDYFLRIRSIFTSHMVLPVLTTPGDNEWNDCPKPALSPHLFATYYTSLATYIQNPPYPLQLHHPSNHPENYVFLHQGVLIIACNLVGGQNRNDDWYARINDNINLVIESAKSYRGKYRCVLIFGHSFRGKFEVGIKRWFKNENVPVVYFHGNDHSWGWTEGRYDDWPQFLSVQVDQGGKAPPIKVSIRGEAEDDFEQPDGENVFVFGEWMMVNRRGGLYEEKDAVG